MHFLFHHRHKEPAARVDLGPPTSEVILRCPPESKVKPRPPPSEEDKASAHELRAYVDEYVKHHPCGESYAAYEEKWRSNESLYFRYLRAVHGDMKQSKKRILETLQWRREYKPELIPPDEVAPEALTGKHVLTGFDLEGRPILYLRPGRENTKPSPRQIRYMVWSLERGIDLMPPGQETLTIVVDFYGASLSTMPSLSTARHVAHILQTHYVERLGRAFVVHMPYFISAFFSTLSPFLDPVTRDKIRFSHPCITDFVAPSQLDAQFEGGTYNYLFDFETYWKSLVERCKIAPDGQRIVEAAP